MSVSGVYQGDTECIRDCLLSCTWRSTMEKISLWAKVLITENIKHQLNQKNNPVNVCTDLARVGSLCICVYFEGWKRRRDRHIHVFSNIQDKYSTCEFKFWLACCYIVMIFSFIYSLRLCFCFSYQDDSSGSLASISALSLLNTGV